MMAALGMLILMLTACASGVTKEYAGPTLPEDRIALIESGPYTHIEKVDGKKLTTLRVAVNPGEHVVQMRPSEQDQPYREYIFYTSATGTAKFAAEAGHKYLAYVDFVPSKGPADEEKGSGYTWIGYILDKSTGNKVANTGYLPVSVEPRGFPSGATGIPSFRTQ
jgi:hypothetical protein